MPDSNTSSGKLADVLVGVLDRIRGIVHTALGTRSYRVFVVTRRWTGGKIGEGSPDVTFIELLPRPLVDLGTSDRLGPAGREGAGSVTLTEVSLTYSQLELEPLTDGATEVAYKLVDGAGQKQRDMWCVLNGSPITRRGDKRGDNHDWKIKLKQSSDMGDLDGVDA